MARESKGQQVKSFKNRVPQPNQSYADEVAKVYFKADEGYFYIYLPEHIGEVVKSGFEGLGSNGFGAYVRAKQVEDVVEDYGAIQEKYLSIIQSEGAVKVIRYRFLCQHPGQDYFGDPFRFDHSYSLGAGTALLLEYEVLWRSGNRLFYGHYVDDELRLQDKGPVPDPHGRFHEKNRLIEWTEEREQFFDGMKKGLSALIMQMKDFLGGDLAQNIAQLASGERTLMLAAPRDD